MFQRIFTTEQLSTYFRHANNINICFLFADMLQNKYLPNSVIIDRFIDQVSNFSIFVVAAIMISQAILIFRKNHPVLIAKYTIMTAIIEIILSTFFLWLLVIDNYMATVYSEFIGVETHKHHIDARVSYLLIFIIMILVMHLYQALEMKNNQILGDDDVKAFLIDAIKTFLKKYIFILVALSGLMHLQSFTNFDSLLIVGNTYIISHAYLYFDICLCIISALLIFDYLRYVYSSFMQRTN